MIDALGRPIDGKGPLPQARSLSVPDDPPPAHARQRVGAPLDLGVRAINTFLTTCRGQRMGIFSGSGVGKSVLLSMLARYTPADVAVIGLVGERGREVQEFLQDDLGEEGLARSVVVVATSDEPALMRRNAAYLTLALAEYFRDQGASVLCMIDSVTRFAMAQRETSASRPASRRPPRATRRPCSTSCRGSWSAPAPAPARGTITGIFTVLVEGDDHNEPVADAVARHPRRAHRDGARDRRARALSGDQRAQIGVAHDAAPPTRPIGPSSAKARQVLATYADMEELIRLGAYRAGSSAEVDEAIRLFPALDAFLPLKGRCDHRADTELNRRWSRLADILERRRHKGRLPITRVAAFDE